MRTDPQDEERAARRHGKTTSGLEALALRGLDELECGRVADAARTLARCLDGEYRLAAPSYVRAILALRRPAAMFDETWPETVRRFSRCLGWLRLAHGMGSPWARAASRSLGPAWDVRDASWRTGDWTLGPIRRLGRIVVHRDLDSRLVGAIACALVADAIGGNVHDPVQQLAGLRTVAGCARLIGRSWQGMAGTGEGWRDHAPTGQDEALRVREEAQSLIEMADEPQPSGPTDWAGTGALDAARMLAILCRDAVITSYSETPGEGQFLTMHPPRRQVFDMVIAPAVRAAAIRQAVEGGLTEWPQAADAWPMDVAWTVKRPLILHVTMDPAAALEETGRTAVLP